MKRKGFTLVELIVSLTIFSLLLGSIFYALKIELGIWKRIVGSAEKQQIANMVLSRIVRDIRSAKELLPASTNQKLGLEIGSDTIEYDLLNHKIRRKKNNYSAYLTTQGELEELSFSYPKANLVEIKVEGFTTQTCLRN